MTYETRLFINGDYEAGQGAALPSHEPATGKLLAEVASADAAQIDRAVRAAHAAFGGWSQTSPKQRSLALLRIADAIEQQADSLADVESANAGKPWRFVKGAELANVADVFRFFGTAVRNVPGPAATGYRSSRHTRLASSRPSLPGTTPC